MAGRRRPVASHVWPLLIAALFAQDVYVPPVPIGIARTGKVRTVETPIPFPDETRAWVRLETPRFDVISSASAERTRAMISDIETLASALGGRPTRRATIFLFDSRSDSQPYFDLLFARENARATGAYVRHEGGGTMFIDASRRTGIERTAMHELIHDLLRERELLPPLWIEEGLAEYFSTAVVENGQVVAGQPPAEAEALLRRTTPMTLDALFAVDAESPLASSPHFYAQSRAAVDWLMRLDSKAFFPFAADVARGESVEAALSSRFGKSPADLDKGIRRRPLFAHRVVFDAAPVALEEGTRLDRATLLFELGRFLSHVAGAETETQRHYAEALRVNPRHAKTLAATGQFEAALAVDPDNDEVLLLFAETLMTTATGPFAGIFEPEAGDEADFRKARALAERALALGGDAATAHGLVGTSYLVEKDPTAGIAALERARALAPQRMDFALNLYAMYLANDQRTKADALYAAAFEPSHDKQIVFAARNALVTAETARANRLAAGGKLDEAAGVLRDLAVLTPDATARRELEAESRRLGSIAEVNRHITQYNEAISLANTGRNRDAVRVLDALLAVATDEQVVRDAKRLRAQLRSRL